MTSPSPTHLLTSERTGLRQLAAFFIRYRRLLGLLVWRDIVVRYKQTVIGILWVLLQPIFSALIFTIIFGVLIKMPTDGTPYLIFAFSGTVIWRLFALGVDRSTISILREEHLITKVYFPKWILPLSEVGGVFLDFLISLLVLFILLPFFGIFPTWHLLLLLPAIALVLLLTASVGISLALLCSRFRDLGFVVTYMLQVLQFASPVFYSISLFGHRWDLLAYLNPLTGLFELFRFSLLGTTHFSLEGFGLSLLMEGIVLLISLKVIFELEDDLVDII